MLLLAQSTAPDAITAWNVILTLGVLVAIVGNVVSAVRSGRAQRRDVTILENAVGREEFDRHAAQNREDHQIIFAKIEEGDARAAENLANALKDINRDLRKVSNGVAALCARNGVKPDGGFEV